MFSINVSTLKYLQKPMETHFKRSSVTTLLDDMNTCYVRYMGVALCMCMCGAIVSVFVSKL